MDSRWFDRFSLFFSLSFSPPARFFLFTPLEPRGRALPASYKNIHVRRRRRWQRRSNRSRYSVCNTLARADRGARFSQLVRAAGCGRVEVKEPHGPRDISVDEPLRPFSVIMALRQSAATRNPRGPAEDQGERNFCRNERRPSRGAALVNPLPLNYIGKISISLNLAGPTRPALIRASRHRSRITPPST